MKIKLLSVIIAATAAFTSNSHAVTLSLAGISNTSVGFITLDPDGAGPAGYGLASGRAIFVSTSDSLVGVAASMNDLLATQASTSAQFDAALASLIGTTNAATSPGIVRGSVFSAGALSSTGLVEMGNVANSTYLFLVAESSGLITGIGAYTGSKVPAAGSVTFNAAFSGDGLGVGTSVFAAGTPNTGFQLKAAVPEPSAALLGAIGVLGLLRRRRI